MNPSETTGFTESAEEVLHAYDVDFSDGEDLFADVIITVIDGGVSVDLYAHKFILGSRSRSLHAALAAFNPGRHGVTYVCM